jgi:hypothetical protein
MSKFYVMCSETVWYRVEVEADTAEAAHEMVVSGAVDLGEPYDGANFEIDDVVAQETV